MKKWEVAYGGVMIVVESKTISGALKKTMEILKKEGYENPEIRIHYIKLVYDVR